MADNQKAQGNAAELTPQSIPTTSFAQKAKEYEAVSLSIADSEEKVARTEFALKAWLNENGFYAKALSGNLTDLWDDIKVMKPAEVDEKKTAELRKKYSELVKAHVNEKIGLQKKRTTLGDIKNYIVFLKEITGLTQRGGGKEQKGGQQPQG